jgi:hypothetical protein
LAPRLNLRQQAFVQHYLKCGNASEACRRAGYRSAPNRHGSRLLTNVDIRKVLDKRMAEEGLTQKYLLAKAKEVLERCLQAEPVRGRDGKIIEGEYTFNATGANQAIKNLADIGGFRTEARQNPENRPRDLNDRELEAEIRRALEGAESGAPGTPEGPAKSDRVH